MNQNVRRITVAALGAALVCICTSVFKFPSLWAMHTWVTA